MIPNRKAIDAQIKYPEVLVVDDDAGICSLITEVLEECKCKVTTADCGASALDYYAADPTRFALVILDLGLPGMSGEEVLRRIHDIHPQTRIVVSSGYAERMNAHELSRLGVVATIPKPYGTRDLKRLVEALI